MFKLLLLFTEVDPGLATPPPVRIAGQGVATYGKLPPAMLDIEDLCPPQVACPECLNPKDFKCQEGSISLYDLVGKLEIKPFGNETYPGLPNRTLGTQILIFFLDLYKFNKLLLKPINRKKSLN